MGAVCRGWVASRQRRLGRRRAIRLAQSRRRVGAGRGLPTRAGLPRARRGPRLAAAAAGRRAASSVVRPRGSDREGSLHLATRARRLPNHRRRSERRSRPSASRPRDRTTTRPRRRSRTPNASPRRRRPPRPARSRPPPDPVAPPRQPRHPVPTESRPASCRVPETGFQDPTSRTTPKTTSTAPPPKTPQRARSRASPPSRSTMTASSTSLAGSGRTSDACVRRPADDEWKTPAPRGVSTRARAPRARVVRPASTPLGDGGRTRRTNPRRRTRPRHPPPSRTTICSVPSETTTRGWWTRNLRRSGRCRRREISRRRIPGTSPRFISTRRAGNRRGNWRRRRRSRRRSSSRRLAISPRVHVPVTRGVHAREGTPAVPASYVSFARRAGRDRTPAPSPLAFGPILAAAAAATPRTARYGNLDSRELAPVSAGPGSGPGVTITTARGRALGRIETESPLGRVPEETIHGNDSEKDANGENRGDDEKYDDDGEKTLSDFRSRGGRRIPCLRPPRWRAPRTSVSADSRRETAPR